MAVHLLMIVYVTVHWLAIVLCDCALVNDCFVTVHWLTIVLCDSALPDDGPVRPETCTS